jgi:hypothetical protein
MPPLTNPRHEKFVQGLVEGKPKVKAYGDAGYVPDRGHAVRLAANGSIKERYSQLFNETIPMIKWDREAVNLQYTELLIKLKEANKLEAAVKTVDSISKVNGLIVTRHETGKAGEFDTLSDHELIELIAEPLDGAGAFAADDGDDTVDDDADEA